MSGPISCLHVEQLGIVRVLGAGAGPQQALGAGAGLTQGSEAGTAENFLVALIGELGVGDGDLALQLGAFVRQQRIEGGIDPADEEARHRGDAVHRLSLLHAAFQSAQVGLRHRYVALDGEQQGDVDVQTVGDELFDRGQAGLSGGHLDHHVGPVQSRVQVACLADGALGVVSQVGRDLQTHHAIHPVGGLIDRPQDVGGIANVLDGQGEEQLAAGQLGIFAQHPPQDLVVLVTGRQRLVEDRRIGRETAQVVVLDHRGQSAGGQHGPVNMVAPDALAGGVQFTQGFVLVRHGSTS